MTASQKIQGMTVMGIGDGAFNGTQAKVICVPDTVVDFGKSAFGEDTDSDIQVVYSPDSATERYAVRNGLNYVYVEEALTGEEATVLVLEDETEISDIYCYTYYRRSNVFYCRRILSVPP